MTDIADKPSDLDDSIIALATGDDLAEFMKRCKGRIRPFFVRPELIGACATGGEEVIKLLGPGVITAITYADMWLANFHGQDHGTVCGCCSKEFECKAERNHTEVGGFMTMQDENFDTEIGGMVLAVCRQCAEQDDRAVYEKFSAMIGGRYVTNVETGAPVPAPEPAGEDLPKVPEPLPAVLGETGTHVVSEETKDIVKGLVGND